MHRLIQDAFRQRYDRNRQYSERLIKHIHSRAVFLEENLDRKATGNLLP
jgi:hypothetical protein